MAYTIRCGSITKKRNSTAVPADTALPGSFDITLKDGCDQKNPVFLISAASFPYNYVKWDGRYYFVTDIRFVRNNLYEVSCREDVLATHKTAIGAMKLYVTRAYSNFDGSITDNMYPGKNAITSSQVTITSPFASTFGGGCFIVSVIGGKAGSIGGVSYYIFGLSEFATLTRYIMSDDFLQGMTFGSVTDDYMKAELDPFKYITGAMWFPVDPTSSGVWVKAPVKLGWWTLPSDYNDDDMEAYYLSSSKSGVYSFISTDVTVPRHPQAATRGVYMNGAPFSQYMLSFGPFGNIDIDPNMIADISGNVNKLLLDFKVDFITGKGWLQIAAGLRTIKVVEAMMGVPVSVSSLGTQVQSIQRLAGRWFHGMENIMDILGTESLTGDIEKFATKIGNNLSMANAIPETSGSMGSMLAYNTPTYLQATFFSAVDDAPDHNGRPLCKDVTINTLSGFLKCQSPDVYGVAGTDAEISEITDLLSSGIFYE